MPPDANLRKISAFIEQELLDDESKEQKKIPKKSLLAAMEKAAAAEETPRKQGYSIHALIILQFDIV